MKAKPFIGLNMSVMKNEDDQWYRFVLGSRYTDAVRKAGGVPLLLPATNDKDIIMSYLDRVDGVLLVGGPDLHPKIYGDEEKLATVVTPPKLRQEFDLALARAAMSKNIPLMGVCMGCQVINVAAGGTLYQDILEQVEGASVRHYRKIDPYYPLHTVKISPDSLLYQIIGKQELEVNSAHHQSVLEPGKGLRATAFSEDGVVECIEAEDERFVLGIQWHPEAIQDRPDQLSLFRALVSAASE